jgi:hypothetical protein
MVRAVLSRLSNSRCTPAADVEQQRTHSGERLHSNYGEAAWNDRHGRDPVVQRLEVDSLHGTPRTGRHRTRSRWLNPTGVSAGRIRMQVHLDRIWIGPGLDGQHDRPHSRRRGRTILLVHALLPSGVSRECQGVPHRPAEGVFSDWRRGRRGARWKAKSRKPSLSCWSAR